jgi:hypothetical protein
MSSDTQAINITNDKIDVISLLDGTLSIMRAISPVYDISQGVLDAVSAVTDKWELVVSGSSCIRVYIQNLTEDRYVYLIETLPDYLSEPYFLGEGEAIRICGPISMLISGIEAVNRINKVEDYSFKPIHYRSYRTRRGYEPLYNRQDFLDNTQMSKAKSLIADIDLLGRVTGRDILDKVSSIISNHYRPLSSFLLAIIENSTRESELWEAIPDTGVYYDYSLVISLPRVIQGLYGELIRQALRQEARGQPFLFDVINNEIHIESDDSRLIERLLVDLIAVDTVLMLAAGTDSLAPIAPYVISS